MVSVAIENSKILVTGGSGMVGHAMKKVLPHAHYPTRNELDLLNEGETSKYLNKNKFDVVVHLAARVGGVKANTDYIGEFYTDNIRMNTNLLRACSKSEVKKVVSMLSTCVFPNNANYPLTEDQLHNGEPHISNYGYAYAKRMLEVQSRTYRQQYGHNYICVIPNNLYGENDNYDLENGHVIPALMRRIWEAKLLNQPSVEVWGNGAPLREFTHSSDIASILLFLLENYDSPVPINIGNTSETSIKDIVDMLCEFLEYEGHIMWNTDKPQGQFRKPSSNKLLLELGWDHSLYTDLRKGLKQSCEWFKMSYPDNIRGKH